MFHGYVEGLPLTSASIIIDLGTFKGYTTKLLSTLYGCKIYTFEPMIPFYKEAVVECSTHPNIEVLPYGLGVGNQTFLMDNRGDSSSMCVGTPSEHAEQCELKDFFSFLEERNIASIDLLHVNIEGGEYDLLDYIIAKGYQSSIGCLIVQFHYKSDINDAKFARYFEVLSHTHRLVYDYHYVWTKWVRI
jgi:FkbM family methyltransferase